MPNKNEDNELLDFLTENKGKNVRLILMSGFQLRGRLDGFDTKHMKIYTDMYGNARHAIVPHSAVSTYLPA